LASGGVFLVEASASAAGWVEEGLITINQVSTGQVRALARAGRRVPFEGCCAGLWEAFAIVGVVVPVVANWARAMFLDAVANSGVPVVAVVAILVWCTEASAGSMVEILFISALV
jgi:hypothetical protein